MDLTEANMLAVIGRCHRDEALVKDLLGRWVSELEPAVAYDKRGNVIGLTLADAQVGSKPFILRG
jgi:hypothetical protein